MTEPDHPEPPRARQRSRRASHRAPGPLVGLGASLRPGGVVRVGPVESLVVLLVASLSTFLRIGSTGRRGVVWAEDGAVFLQGAHDHALPAVVLEPYAGYAHVVPRTLSELISWLPTSWQGLGTVLVAALVAGLLAVFAYHVLAAQGGRIAATAAALVIAAVPVGPEILANLANLQWLLLAVGCLAPFWAPRHRGGRIASMVVLGALVLSCPFGPVAAGLAVLVWLLERSRAALALAAVGVVASVVQLVVMATAPAREGLAPAVRPGDLVGGWLRRALADGILGTGRYGDPATPSPAVTAGVVLGLVVLVLAALVLVRRPRWSATLAPVLALLLASSLTFAAPIVATSSTTVYPMFPGRYFVAPALLAVIAVALLGARAWEAPADVRGVSARVVATGLLVATATGLATSWWNPESFGRGDGPTWADQVDLARLTCQRSDLPADAPVGVAIAPEDWSVRLTCADVS